MRVPEAVRPLVGRAEVRRSLGTYSSTKARSLAARYAARVVEAFNVVAIGQLSPQRAQIVIQNCFADLIGDAEARGGYVPRTSEPDLECDQQEFLSGEVQRDLKDQIASCNFDGSVLEQATSLLGRRGVKLDALAPPVQLNLLSGIARAMVERERWFQLRIADRLAPFVPADPLFGSAEHAQIMPAATPSFVGPSIGQAVAEYLHYGEGQWVPKTLAARRVQLGFFIEHVGAEQALASITADHVRSYRDALCSLHRRHGKMVGATFAAKQTPNKAYRISNQAAAINFGPVKAFFRWARSTQGWMDTNPAEGIRVVMAKQPKGQKVRRPFNREELRTLFTSPIFVGCFSKGRRYLPGKLVIKDAKFWLPILGYYTGARLGELVQLHVGDVCLTNGIPHLSINEDNGPSTSDADRKHVKSKAGIRLVPLHPDVMALGFAEFVAQRAKAKGKSKVRLFADFQLGRDGQASTVASKFFARFMDSVGLDDPRLVFHSFRHNAEDAFRDALTPQYVTDRIIGHSDGSTAGAYGNGPSLEVLYEAVCKMKLKVRLPIG